MFCKRVALISKLQINSAVSGSATFLSPEPFPWGFSLRVLLAQSSRNNLSITNKPFFSPFGEPEIQRKAVLITASLNGISVSIPCLMLGNCRH